MGFSKNRLFTLTVIPDTGTETKTGNVHINFIITSFVSIILVFFVCLFFIIGYQIKLSQEKKYHKTLAAIHNNLNRVFLTDKKIKILLSRLDKLHHMDKAYRLISVLPVPDDQIYMGGTGGHEIIDNAFFASLDHSINTKIKPVAFGIKSLDQKIKTEKKSMDSIRNFLLKRIERELYTPTILPTFSMNVTSPFGMRINPVTREKQFHDAVDFSGNIGDAVSATASGRVIEATYNDIRGYYVEIEHKFGYVTLYAHLNKMLVQKGDIVRKGSIVGTLGKSGRTTGANLHYSVSLNGVKVNPSKYY